MRLQKSTNDESKDDLIDYSIVIPVYFNEGALAGTFSRLEKMVIRNNQNRVAEIIFVDDGSGDGSFEELICLQKKNPDLVKIIKLTRNFGQVNAMMAGFAEAKGRCVVAISADGQDPEELINEMIRIHFEENVEIVVCTRRDRDESFFRKITSKVFYGMMRKMSFPNMPPGGFDFFLLGRKSLRVLLRHHESNLFIQGQILWTGYEIRFLSYIRKKREVGQSRWTLGRKATYLIDGVMGYSFLPIRLMSVAGGVIALSGFIYAALIILIKLIWGHPVQGWAPLMVVILLLSGIQLLMMGVMGEYVWRILAQVRKRDSYTIEEIF